MANCKGNQNVTFIIMLILTCIFFIAEFGVGLYSNCMSIIAGSFHILSHFVSLCVGFASFRFARKAKRSQDNFSFGFGRAEVIGALINIVLLLAVCFAIMIEAVKRILIPETMRYPHLVLLTSGLALLVSVLGILLFQQHRNSESDRNSDGYVSNCSSHTSHSTIGHSFVRVIGVDRRRLISETSTNLPIGVNRSRLISETSTNLPIGFYDHNVDIDSGPIASSVTAIPLPLRSNSRRVSINPNIEYKLGETRHPKTKPKEVSLNIEAVFLHIICGTLLSCIVMISAACVLYTKTKWVIYVDPIMTVLIVFLIVATSVSILKKSASILMQSVPANLHIDDLKGKLLRRLSGVLNIHEFHVWQLNGDKIVASVHLECRHGIDHMRLSREVKDLFHNEGIHSTTIQLEVPDILYQLNQQNLGEARSMCRLECSSSACAKRQCCDSNVGSRMSLPEIPETGLSNSTSTQKKILDPRERLLTM